MAGTSPAMTVPSAARAGKLQAPMAEGAGKAGDAAAEVGGILEIDLAALHTNYRDLAERAAPAACAAVVKADAYGIGLEAAGRALIAAGCDTLIDAPLVAARRLTAGEEKHVN